MGFLAAFGNAGHDEHAMWTEWIGGSFDPETFDIDAVNRLLHPADPISRLL